MAHNKLTIELPGSMDALHNILQVLLQYGLISEKKARTIEQERKTEKPIKASRWAQVAEEMSAQEYLKGEMQTKVFLATTNSHEFCASLK